MFRRITAASPGRPAAGSRPPRSPPPPAGRRQRPPQLVGEERQVPVLRPFAASASVTAASASARAVRSRSSRYSFSARSGPLVVDVRAGAVPAGDAVARPTSSCRTSPAASVTGSARTRNQRYAPSARRTRNSIVYGWPDRVLSAHAAYAAGGRPGGCDGPTRPPAAGPAVPRQVDVLEPPPVVVVERAVRPGRPHDLRHRVGQLPEPLLARPQRVLGPPAIGHVLEVHAQPVRGRVRPAPRTTGRAAAGRTRRTGPSSRRPSPGGTALEVRAGGGRELLPEVAAEQPAPRPRQHPLGLGVHVREPPRPVDREERVGDALEDRPGPLVGQPRGAGRRGGCRRGVVSSPSSRPVITGLGCGCAGRPVPTERAAILLSPRHVLARDGRRGTGL
jgi:hypothetical protein